MRREGEGSSGKKTRPKVLKEVEAQIWILQWRGGIVGGDDLGLWRMAVELGDVGEEREMEGCRQSDGKSVGG